MPQPATNAKIEELRFRVKTDPKSRLFYPLAEELRKASQLAEAESVLRTGLTSHPTYLSAWVSLGRVLRDQQKYSEAVQSLTKALQIDPGNIVAARLLAEAYLSLGEKVEAIKKYKLVHALLPADEEVEGIIHRLDLELNSPIAPPEPQTPAAAEPIAEAPPPFQEQMPPAPFHTEEPSSDKDVFDVTYSKLRKGLQVDMDTGDSEPMRAEHSESPFEEASADLGYSADAFAIEQPEGLQVMPTPLTADLPAPFEEDDSVAPGFIRGAFDANVAPPPPDPDDFAKTITMADLYANQGLIDEARDIYEDILARDPDNASVRAKLEALAGAQHSGLGAEAEEPQQTEMPSPEPQALSPEPQAPSPEPRGRNPKIEKLEGWLSRVARKEAGRV